jgi:hypothetical protein
MIDLEEVMVLELDISTNRVHYIVIEVEVHPLYSD